MPSKKEIIDVICIYILENNLHPKMRKYIMTVLEHATINRALNLYAHHIGDVGVEIALPGKAKNGWKKYCKLFCDNIIFWALVDTGGDVEKQRKNSIRAILEALEEQDVNWSMVKIVQQGKISFDGFFHDCMVKKFAKKASGDVEYISIKVTLHSIKLSTLLRTLHDAIVKLENKYIFLQDVDIVVYSPQVSLIDSDI
ncbi:MAG: hypothetical protein BYD32DRAFT_436709 [Podila humilis]|nr:MAG: hypothetical protein BYD32DRAFT_436709 [Podila humilis]